MEHLTLQVRTGKHTQFVDITREINEKIAGTKVQEGICYIYVPHTTAGITINENADPSVPYDIIKQLDIMVPWKNGYKHMEGNSAAHIKASLLGNSCYLIISKGRLLTGTWQAVFFCEFDGLRNRSVYIKIEPSSELTHKSKNA